MELAGFPIVYFKGDYGGVSKGDVPREDRGTGGIDEVRASKIAQVWTTSRQSRSPVVQALVPIFL